MRSYPGGDGTGQPQPRRQRALSLDDIADLRAYEHEREGFRRRIIELKRLRRVGVGPLVSLVFENRDTVRFQVQEMVRAERMLSDELVLAELEVYNPLIPDPGELSATMLLELTDEDQLREWLAKLVGIERAAYLRLGALGPDPARQDGGLVIRCQVDAAHATQLTREEVTASVHYVRFLLGEDEIGAFADGPVWLGIDLPEYAHEVELAGDVRAELLDDLRQ